MIILPANHKTVNYMFALALICPHVMGILIGKGNFVAAGTYLLVIVIFLNFIVILCFSCIWSTCYCYYQYCYCHCLFQLDLVHLGAKYGPCMRWDETIDRQIQNDRNKVTVIVATFHIALNTISVIIFNQQQIIIINILCSRIY